MPFRRLHDLLMQLSKSDTRHMGEYQEQKVYAGLFATSNGWSVSTSRQPGASSLWLGMHRLQRRRATLILLAMLSADHADEVAQPTGVDVEVEVAPMVSQLVGSLTQSPASPPAPRAALVAA